jgi:hypothetical protein
MAHQRPVLVRSPFEVGARNLESELFAQRRQPIKRMCEFSQQADGRERSAIFRKFAL